MIPEYLSGSVLLIADDNIMNLQLLSNYLTRMNFKILVAEDGQEAYKRAESGKPDLILLDIILPKKNGFQVCRQIKTSPDTHDIRIVMVSSKSEEADRFWGMKQGADAYIAKPIVEQDLLNTVAKLLKKS